MFFWETKCIVYCLLILFMLTFLPILLINKVWRMTMADCSNKVDRENLSIIEKSLTEMDAYYRLAENVHKYSKALGAQCKKFLTLDIETYKFSTLLAFTTVVSEITSFAKNEPNVMKVLATIATASGVEPETGLPVQELLARTWSLAKAPGSPTNAREMILDNLRHNIETGGGCLAGIAARLTQPYCNLIFWYLQHKMGISQQSQEIEQARAIQQSREQEQIDRAIQQSREQEQIDSTIRESREQEQIDRAIQESREQLAAAAPVASSSFIPAYQGAREITQGFAITEDDEELQLALAISASLTLK